MQAYLNDEKLKEKTVSAMKADIAAERLVKGHYWNEARGNGCFVGCVIRGESHIKFELQLGIPQVLARIADCTFEGLSYEDAKKFSVDFLQAIKPGADLSLAWPKFAVFMLVDKASGVIKFAKDEKTKIAIQTVAELYQRMINGEKISLATWRQAKDQAWEARRTARAADAYAAYAYAADAAYAYAAYADAAYADAAYAADAADAYAYAADAYAYAADAYAYAADADARSRHFATLATALIRILGE